MSELASSPPHTQLSTLLRGDTSLLRDRVAGGDSSSVRHQLVWIVVGAGTYGAAMGAWRAPEQALYVAVKLPLIVLLTTLGNALLNAMLAPLLGLPVTFRQSLLAVLMSFAVAGAILGAFAPVAAFLAWAAPPMSAEDVTGPTYLVVKLVHVAAIAFAGVAGNVRLLQLLRDLAGSRAVARRVLSAWLGANLFFGSQLAWILRPFIGAPHLPVAFVRPDVALQGNFYENVLQSVLDLLRS
jgi:hypothetical protein